MYIFKYLSECKSSEITFNKLYKCCPFLNTKDLQIPANAIEYGLAELVKLQRNYDQENYTPKQWRDYKQLLLDKLCMLITKDTVTSFDEKTCSFSLRHLAELKRSERKGYNIPEIYVTLLAQQFYEKRSTVSPKSIVYALLNLSQLHSEGITGFFTSMQLKNLMTELSKRRSEMPPGLSAGALNALGMMMESGKGSLFDPKYAQSLITQLHTTCSTLKPKGIAQAMWGLEKLSEAANFSIIDSILIQDLLTQLYEHRDEATFHDMVKILLAVTKLLEADKVKSFKSLHVQNLILHLQAQPTDKVSQNIANMFYILGKMVEFNQINALDSCYVHTLTEELYKQRSAINAKEIAISIWACGIIHTRFPLNPDIIDKLVSLAPILKMSPVNANETLMGICLLGLEKKHEFRLTTLIKQCRPASTLSKTRIAPYIEHAKNWEKEAFLYPFFVDLLVERDGKKFVIEFDGPHHKSHHHRCFDHFRDNLLREKGYEIIRIPYSEEHDKAFVKTVQKDLHRFYSPSKVKAPIPRIYQKSNEPDHSKDTKAETRFKFTNY